MRINPNRRRGTNRGPASTPPTITYRSPASKNPPVSVAVEMVDCRERAVVARGAAAACTTHQYELATAAAREESGAGLDPAPVGAVCGQHLRQPVTVSGLLNRIDVLVDDLWTHAPRKGAAQSRDKFKAATAELVTLVQALAGAAEAEHAATAGPDAYGQFLADAAPGGER